MNQYKKVRLSTKLILGIFYIWPRPVQKFFSSVLACFWFYVLRLRRDLVEKQIKNVFPDFSQKKIKNVGLKSFYNLILILFEYSYFAFSTKKVIKHTKLKNKKIVDDLLKQNKPIFFVTGHLANGEIILFRMCLEGYKLNLIGKRVGVKFIDSLLFEIRELSGLKHIPPKHGAAGITKAASKKEPVVFVHDQFRHPPRGLKTKFLGLETHTNSALAFFALKTGAEVVPVNLYRESDQVVVDFQEPIPFEKKYGNEEQDILHMTQKYNDILENFIRERPEGWMWVHKRWKKPNKR